jgi:class 3 adenylate cyclase/tetratricopeptide (TPR) repeat protein
MSGEACPACGAENAPGALFCGRCGTPLARKCFSCGAAVALDAAFCTSCGTELGESPRPSAEERKVVSVLFADLVGFTERAERLDPEEVRALLDGYHSRVRVELERFGGTMEKFIGDAVLGLFGAPLAHEDDPERAVRAALAIREAAAEADETVRVGVTTGEALITRDARPLEGEGMAAGDVVNTASRLQSAAGAGLILVDEATFRATEHAIEYGESPPVTAKGKAEPVKVWEALAPRARLGVDIAFGGAAPLIGRDVELDTVHDALARAKRERTAQLITLVGLPGIGKSRLVYELWAAAEADPELVYWRQGRSLPYGAGVSFWALGEMAKSHAGILESDDAESAETKLLEAVEHAIADEAERRWVAGHLRPLVGLGAAGSSSDRRDEAFAAWRRFFEALAEERPLVLVFEDIHWADDGLLDFIDQLVEWTTDVPVLVVCTARPELLDRRPGWGGGKRNAATISLTSLPDEDVSRLLAELLDEPKPELVSRAGGNPLYAEEYARMLAQSGNGGSLDPPDSVQGIIAARLDTLPLDEKAVLQDASVLGKVFWAGELAHLTGLGTDAVERHLRSVERKEFVRRERRSSVAGETAYVFRHALVRDVAYGQLPRGRRIEKHRLAAQWIESLGGDRSEDLADVVAHHYLIALELLRETGKDAGQVAESARVALRQAGDRAASLSAFSAAARFYEQALALWPADGDRPQLLLRLGRALYQAYGTGADVLAEAGAELLDAGERGNAAEAEVMLAELAWLEGRRDVVAAHSAAAEQLVADEPASAAKAYVLANLSRFLSNADENDAAIRAGFEAYTMAEELALDELRAHTLITIGTSRALAGDLAGLVDLEHGIRIAKEATSGQSARGLNNLASATAHLGDLERAFELYAEARAEAERFGQGVALRWLAAERVLEYYWRGLWDEARAAAKAVLATNVASEPFLQEVPARIVRARIFVAAGEVKSAREESSRALEVARAAGEPQNLFPALAAAASLELAAAEGDRGSALVDELLEAWRDTQPALPSFWLAELAFTLTDLSRGEELDDCRHLLTRSTPWLEAAAAVARRDWLTAAQLFARIGALPEAAAARERSAADLARAGRQGEAEDQLRQALDFYRSAGALAYARRTEDLLVRVS